MIDAQKYVPVCFHKFAFSDITYYVSSSVEDEFHKASPDKKLMLAAAVVQRGQLIKMRYDLILVMDIFFSNFAS